MAAGRRLGPRAGRATRVSQLSRRRCASKPAEALRERGREKRSGAGHAANAGPLHLRTSQKPGPGGACRARLAQALCDRQTQLCNRLEVSQTRPGLPRKAYETCGRSAFGQSRNHGLLRSHPNHGASQGIATVVCGNCPCQPLAPLQTCSAEAFGGSPPPHQWPTRRAVSPPPSECPAANSFWDGPRKGCTTVSTKSQTASTNFHQSCIGRSAAHLSNPAPIEIVHFGRRGITGSARLEEVGIRHPFELAGFALQGIEAENGKESSINIHLLNKWSPWVLPPRSRQAPQVQMVAEELPNNCRTIVPRAEVQRKFGQTWPIGPTLC